MGVDSRVAEFAHTGRRRGIRDMLVFARDDGTTVFAMARSSRVTTGRILEKGFQRDERYVNESGWERNTLALTENRMTLMAGEKIDCASFCRIEK